MPKQAIVKRKPIGKWVSTDAALRVFMMLRRRGSRLIIALPPEGNKPPRALDAPVRGFF